MDAFDIAKTLLSMRAPEPDAAAAPAAVPEPPQSGFASAVAAAAVARSQQRTAAPPRRPAGARAVAFEAGRRRARRGAVRALPPPVAGGVSLALSRDSFAGLANPTFGGRFVAARRLDDAAETELVRQLLADERGSADDGVALPPRPGRARAPPLRAAQAAAPPSPGRGRPAAATVAVVRDAAPGSPDADAPRKERPGPSSSRARPQAPSALEGAENANSAPRSPTSGRAGRKLLRCLDENTPTERSPFSRPANKHFRAAAADAAAAPPDAPLLPQLSPFTKVAAI
ncbi:hypothetical protein JL721_2372 [Aureococcus anophagefferens]|nr:hypothetical protein JL721_2372 [Aureococcus anophagefferens]